MTVAMTACPCGRVGVPLERPTHLAGLCSACAGTVCDDPEDPGYDVWNPEEDASVARVPPSGGGSEPLPETSLSVRHGKAYGAQG